MRYAGILMAILLLPLRAQASNVGHIQQCFTSVLPGQTAILDNDLECPSYPGNEIPIIGTDLTADDNGRVGIEGQLVKVRSLHATGNG